MPSTEPQSESQAAGPLHDAFVLSRLRESDLLKQLNTSPDGLSGQEVRRRLRQYGPNSLREARSTSRSLRIIRSFARQFTHVFAILLWIAAALSFVADRLQPGQGMATIGWAILAVILVNAVFTFIQEYKADGAVEALRQLLPETTWAFRDGQPQQVPRHDIVPGDILLLEEGEQVPADGRVLVSAQMRVDMSALTGESHPKARQSHAITDGATDLLNLQNLVFAGTTVVSGHGRAVVVATGLRTEFGKIARLATTAEPGLSPLQREIVQVTHVVGLVAMLIGTVFSLAGLALGIGFWPCVIFGIGVIVANVPEGLLPTVTLALARASQRMARRKVLIKQLTSVETLGCTTVICTDKTGTLTENRLRVDRVYVDGLTLEVRSGHLILNGRLFNMFDRKRMRPFFHALTLCNNTRRVRRHGRGLLLSGDPTEVALMEFAEDHLATNEERPGAQDFPRMAELPFDADRKRMTTLHWVTGGLVAYVKGAPESLLPLCSRTLSRGSTAPMTAAQRKAILGQSAQFAEEAYRVLAVAMREVESGIAESLSTDAVEQDLTFLGLVALLDPPHREVPEAIARCRKAGIRVVMITGDHPLTALAVARKIGLVSDRSSTVLIEGSRLDTLDERDLHDLLSRPTQTAASERSEVIFARMAPRHKLQVVSALKDLDEIVAVTGDSVNDVPALKKADIGIAMGLAGTDVAKETAHMLLLDDNFASIVNAIEEGRAVYANIRKVVTYVLTSNVPQVIPYLAYALLPIPLPLTVPQILAVDLGTDIVPALGLGADPPHAGVMESPPRSHTERLLSLPLILRTYGFLGLIEAGIALGAFFWFLTAQGWTWGTPLNWSDPLYRTATTVTLAAIVMAQVANVFACRSESLSIFRLGFFTNRFIAWGLAVELALLAVIVYTPFGNSIFGTNPLPGWAWVPLVCGTVALLLAEEARKWLARRLAATVHRSA
jgi:sodium/potassium-transporting ATPase subunit alpha